MRARFSVFICAYRDNDMPVETNLLITPWTMQWLSLREPKSKINIRSSIPAVWKSSEKKNYYEGLWD